MAQLGTCLLPARCGSQAAVRDARAALCPVPNFMLRRAPRLQAPPPRASAADRRAAAAAAPPAPPRAPAALQQSAAAPALHPRALAATGTAAQAALAAARLGLLPLKPRTIGLIGVTTSAIACYQLMPPLPKAEPPKAKDA